MRYPVGLGTQQDFDKNWYIATQFGHPESYGFHEAWDINLKTGGDTDLGQPLAAVASGKIVFFHNNSHPTSGFGRHMILECQTSKGKRWYHYAHCQEITTEIKDIKEGDIIGKLGKSGTTAAHLHFAVMKIDPAKMIGGIDNVANNETELNTYWEKFELLSTAPMPEPGPVMPTELQTYLGVQNDEEAEAKLKEHLGQFDGKCDWGNDGTDRGGYLGSARRRIKELESQPVPVPTDPPRTMTVSGILWILNGIQWINGKISGNYREA